VPSCCFERTSAHLVRVVDDALPHLLIEMAAEVVSMHLQLQEGAGKKQAAAV
jgi:hypothetical protein